MLSADDVAWFATHPTRQFRCRLLTDADRAADTGPYAREASPGIARIVYVRRSDGGLAFAWTPMPEMLIAEEDEGRARFAAQCLPNPPPLAEPDFGKVELIEVSPELAAQLKAQMATPRTSADL